MHSQRLSRQFEVTVRPLRDLQKTCQAGEKQDMDNLLDVVEMYQKKGEPTPPSDHGFGFSEQQINHSIGARNRERMAERAFHARASVR